MNRWFLFCVLTFFVPASVQAETPEGPSSVLELFHPTLEISLAGASQTWVPSLSFNGFYGFGSEKKFQIGLGLRASASLAFGHNVPYTTADAALIDEGKTNTLRFAGMKTYSVNAVFHMKYELLSRWEVGMNIDLVGFGFGGPRTGWYEATDPTQSGAEQASPSALNLLLGGTRDRGQLNSEFYVSYTLTPDWRLRAGLSHFFSEVTTDNAKDFGNRRFRLIRNLFFLAGAYTI